MFRNLRKFRKQRDPEYEIKKSTKSYSRSEKMEAPARILNSAVIEATDNVFNDIIIGINGVYPELGVQLAGSLGAMKGATLELGNIAINKFQKSKRDKLFQKISDYRGVLTTDTIKNIEALPFVFEFAKTLDLINRLANDKKLDFICNCFGVYFLTEYHGNDIDQYEEFLDHLSTLSFREIEILITLYKIESECLSNKQNQQDDKSKNGRESISGKSISVLKQMAPEKWNLNENEMESILTSLCRSGFLRELVGSILGYYGGRFYTTEYFEKFLGYILPQALTRD